LVTGRANKCCRSKCILLLAVRHAVRRGIGIILLSQAGGHLASASAKRVSLLGKRTAAFCRGWLLCVRHGLEDLLLRRHGFSGFADVESWPAVDSAFVGSKPRRSNWALAGRGHPDGNRGRGAWQIGDGDGPGGASRSPIPDKSAPDCPRDGPRLDIGVCRPSSRTLMIVAEWADAYIKR
jgi:hypothetical protein